jgi:hypothetical protein
LFNQSHVFIYENKCSLVFWWTPWKNQTLSALNLIFSFCSRVITKILNTIKKYNSVFVNKKEKKMMTFSNTRKTKLTASIAIVLLMTTAFMLMATPLFAQDEEGPHGGSSQLPSDWSTGNYAEEQPVSGPLPTGATPELERSTEAFLSFRPNPVGLNQIFLVNLWTSPSVHVERFHPNYKVTITKPDATVINLTMNSYCADATAWFEWIADQTGTWTLKFDFLGTYFPAGRYFNGWIVTNTTGSVLGSAYYKPSSTAELTLEVQDDIVYSWPPSPLPTDYWTRPIPPEHREWWSIAGNFPWFGPGGGSMWDELYPNTSEYRQGMSREPMARFAAWVQAPNSAHIVWERVNDLAGIIGGDVGYQTVSGNAGHPSIILNGRAFQTVSRVSQDGPGSQTYWQSYDIRTGEIFWERPLYPGESEPNLIEYVISGGTAVPGEQQGVARPLLLAINGGYLRKYNPFTGAMTLNTSIAPLGGNIGSRMKYYKNGYVVSVQNLGGGNYQLINWTTLGSSSNFASRIVSNITWPWPDLGNNQDYKVDIALEALRFEIGNTFGGTNIKAADMKTGLELWNFNVTAPLTSSGAVQVENGRVAIGFLVDRQWRCWDLKTGEFLWETEKTAYPWGDFWSYSSEAAYGMIFTGTYESFYAFNWTNGETVWRYKAPALFPYETPFIDENGVTMYSWHSSLYIADGKIFTYTCTHTPEQPITRGWKYVAINVTNGEEIWSLPGSGIDSRVFQGAMADGYLALESNYLGTMVVVGKGESATTVTAPDVEVPMGSNMMIKGTVLDQSPAQPGTPAVSKESMSTWMAYLHNQWPIDGFWHNETITGVPVSLTAIHSDGSSYDLGTVTSDGYHGTFGKAWTPPKEGTYKIIASFEGDDSYGSSSASTYVEVGPAPSGGQQQETEEPTTEAPTTEAPTTEAPTSEVPTTEQPSGEAPAFPTTEVIIVAVVAVAVVIGVGAYWALRRRK